jgi:hypothetical protein
MNERHRMQYLDAMGIEMFVPRFVLHGAAQTVQAELPVELRTSSPAEDTLPERSEKPSGGGSLLASLRSANKELKAKVEPKVEPGHAASVNHEAVEKKPESAQFQIGFWWTHSGLIVLDARRPNAALPTDAFLNNVLLANHLIQHPLPGAEVIRWPLAKGRDNSWHAAGAMMQELLQARRGEKPAKFCLAWGKSALRSVMPEADFDQLKFNVFSIPQLNCELLCLPEVEHFLRQCDDKKRLWALFSPLRKAFD